MDSPYFFKGTTYWSAGDEDAQFRWRGEIGCVRDVGGAGRRQGKPIAGGKQA